MKAHVPSPSFDWFKKTQTSEDTIADAGLCHKTHKKAVCVNRLLGNNYASARHGFVDRIPKLMLSVLKNSIIDVVCVIH